MESYNLWMLVIGISCFGAAWLPHLLRGKPISFPIASVAFGAILFSLPLPLYAPDPLKHPHVAEHLTELIVIVALMGVGLKLGRPLGWRTWNSTWRLLGVTMLLCITAFALIGWLVLGLSAAGAILLGAVLAPTDPVLAADVQAAGPLEGESGEIRFALTSESGLNDGLAFPFTNLALAVAAGHAGQSNWFSQWLWHDLLYKVVAGLVVGIVLGYGLAWLVFRLRLADPLAHTGEGIAAIAITLISYATAEVINGYGFLAVFIAALMIRHYEEEHEYHRSLHEFAENVEQLLMAAMLVLFGGALVNGLLDSLTWHGFFVALAFVFLIRPLAGLLGLLSSPMHSKQKTAVAFFGIRGIGSFYYLAYALNQRDFAEAELLWAIVATVVLISIVVHGITATPIMNRLGQTVASEPLATDEASP